MKIYIGTSGWQYWHWKGKFYPKDLANKDFLRFYSKYFNSVEINTSFYHLTKKTTFEKWIDEIANLCEPKTNLRELKTNLYESGSRAKHPARPRIELCSGSGPNADLRRKNNNDFLFAVKFYRLFTHLKKLNLKKEDEKTLKTFLENVSALKEKLGPILIQLPPSFKNKEALEKFIKKFKNIYRELSRTKRELSQTVYNLRLIKNYPLIAVEIRNKNLLNKDVYNFLKKEKIIFVISDSPRWPTEFVKTTDVVYVRFHGKPILFGSKYSKRELKEYVVKIKKLKPKVLFAYFNNDAEGYAIDNALEFKNLVNLL
ncbi:MAG: hypothetical protein KatS3mg095_0555 [Candidatus Parcubacteria bacterium]|nr:MAG: hypothetical protein KatS3mg095_0555 [Candidatus Parcubacteria bacterium]